MITAELYQELVDYIKGRLDEDQRKVFEDRLQQDPELQEELDWELLMLQDDGFYNDLAGSIGKEASAPASPEKPVRGSQFYLPLLAAVLTAFILLGLTALLLNKMPERQDIVIIQPKKQLPINVDTARKIQDNTPDFGNLLAYNDVHTKFRTETGLPDELANLQIAYAESDYRRVLTESKNLSPVRGDADPQEDLTYVNFYKGLAYLELNDDASAIREFNQALRSSAMPQVKNEILWYKALALLRQNRIAECRAILIQLTKNKSVNNRVRQLLKKIPEDATAR